MYFKQLLTSINKTTSRGYWTPAINYFPVESNSEGIQEKIIYYGYFSNFARRKCIIFGCRPSPPSGWIKDGDRVQITDLY